jgi:hypothetical protein
MKSPKHERQSFGDGPLQAKQDLSHDLQPLLSVASKVPIGHPLVQDPFCIEKGLLHFWQSFCPGPEHSMQFVPAQFSHLFDDYE